MPGKEIDIRIGSALRRGAALSHEQKQAAWDRIYRQAGRQMLLPPLEAAPKAKLSWQTMMSQSLQNFWQLVSSFATDEEQYQRAYHSRYTIRYGGVNRDNRFANHLFEPLRFNLMSPAF